MPLGLLGFRTLFVVLYYRMNATVRELNLFHSSDEKVEKHIQEGLSITVPLFPCGWPPRCLRTSLVVYMQTVGRDSSVGIGTRYGLDGTGIESRWGEVSRTHPDRPWGPPSLPQNGYLVSPRSKVAGVCR